MEIIDALPNEKEAHCEDLSKILELLSSQITANQKGLYERYKFYQRNRGVHGKLHCRSENVSKNRSFCGRREGFFRSNCHRSARVLNSQRGSMPAATGQAEDAKLWSVRTIMYNK